MEERARSGGRPVARRKRPARRWMEPNGAWSFEISWPISLFAR